MKIQWIPVSLLQLGFWKLGFPPFSPFPFRIFRSFFPCIFCTKTPQIDTSKNVFFECAKILKIEKCYSISEGKIFTQKMQWIFSLFFCVTFCVIFCSVYRGGWFTGYQCIHWVELVWFGRFHCCCRLFVPYNAANIAYFFEEE